MKINAQKNSYYTFIYLICMLLFSGFVEFRIIWHILILGTFFVMVICCSSTVRTVFGKKIMFVLCAFSGLLLFMSFCVSESYRAIFSNIRSMAYPLCALLSILIIIEYDEQMVFNIFKSKNFFYFFNIMLIINTVVLAIQNQGTGFLIRQSWLNKNTTYFDHCAGLFGMNATNILGLYAVFVMLYNFSYAETKNFSFKRKKLIFAYTLIMMGMQAILSKDNDNIGFYIIFVMFLMLYLLYDLILIKKGRARKLYTAFKYLILAGIVMAIILAVPAAKDLFTRVLKNRIDVMIHYQSVEMTGSNERLHILQYGLTNSFGWLLGKGIGTAKWVDANTFGFVHFGISSIGAYVVLAGIWFYLVYTLLYSYSLYRIMIGDCKKIGLCIFVYLQ